MRIGIDLGGTKIEGIALDASGREVARHRTPTPRGDYAATVGAVRDLVARLEQGAPEPASVGVGIPGAISPATGLVKNANSTWLIGRPFDTDLSVALDRPVRVANDANCFALSEAVDGAAAGAGVVFGVIMGTGVGGGLVVHGRIVDGPNAIGGEWGHNPLPWPEDRERPGPACYCGKPGCIETFLSGPGLEADFDPARSKNAAEIRHLASSGDAAAKAALGRHAARCAKALATVINVVDPEIIVLGGGLSNLAHLYEQVPKLWSRWVFSDFVATRLVPPRHGDSSGVRGAAWLWPESDQQRLGRS